jgi:cold shock CspA family protein
MTGRVRAFDERRGLGEVESGAEVYPFHCTRIADGSRSIPVGAAVTFEVAPGPQGRWEAVAISRV